MKKVGLVILLAFLLIFTGCGSSTSSSAPSTANQKASDSSNSFAIENNQNTAAGGTQSKAEASPAASSTSTLDNSSKIVKTATLQMETLKFDSTVSAILDKCNSLQGYVENSNVTGIDINSNPDTATRTASLKLRIPKQNYITFMNSCGSLGTVIQKEETGDNITSQYYDTEAHLKSLQIQEDRELEILKKATDLKSILELEKELTDVRYQIENLTSSLKRMDNMVDYTTFNINVKEVQKLTEIKAKHKLSLGEQIVKAFKDSCSFIVSILKSIVISIAYILPTLIIIIPIGAAIFFGRKYYVKHKKE